MEKTKDHPVRLLLFILAALFVSGCGNSKLDELEVKYKQVRERVNEIQPALEEANANIESARSENERLSGEVARLRNNAQKFQLDNILLLRHNKELKEWSRKLTDGYGPGIWYMDESTLPVFVQSIPSGDVAVITEALNGRFEKDHLPKIRIKKIENGKVHVGVDDERLLTQRLGSHGAESYLNTVTYSVASVSGIDCVRFEFKGGNHAAPGEHCK